MAIRHSWYSCGKCSIPAMAVVGLGSVGPALLVICSEWGSRPSTSYSSKSRLSIYLANRIPMHSLHVIDVCLVYPSSNSTCFPQSWEVIWTNACSMSHILLSAILICLLLWCPASCQAGLCCSVSLAPLSSFHPFCRCQYRRDLGHCRLRCSFLLTQLSSRPSHLRTAHRTQCPQPENEGCGWESMPLSRSGQDARTQGPVCQDSRQTPRGHISALFDDEFFDACIRLHSTNVSDLASSLLIVFVMDLCLSLLMWLGFFLAFWLRLLSLLTCFLFLARSFARFQACLAWLLPSFACVSEHVTNKDEIVSHTCSIL